MPGVDGQCPVEGSRGLLLGILPIAEREHAAPYIPGIGGLGEHLDEEPRGLVRTPVVAAADGDADGEGEAAAVARIGREPFLRFGPRLVAPVVVREDQAPDHPGTEVAGFLLLQGRQVRQGLVHPVVAHQVGYPLELVLGALLRTGSGRQQGEQEKTRQDGREPSFSHRVRESAWATKTVPMPAAPGKKYIRAACQPALITLVDNRTGMVPLAVGVALVAAVLYLLLTRRTWAGQHLPLPLHPDRPRTGPVPRMARGRRSSVR